MQEEHKKAIQVNFNTLVLHTDLNKMVSALHEKGVLSEPMLEYYANESRTQVERKRHLYRAITRRGPDAFDKMLEVLMETGQWDLVRDLDPNSPLHTRTRRPELQTTYYSPVESDENSYVSIKNKKIEAQKNLRMSGVSAEGPAAAEPRDPPPSPASLPLVPLTCEEHDPARTPTFDVKKSTSFFEEDDSKGLRLYRTRGRHRGAYLLLSYVEFAYGTDDPRLGVEADTDNLKRLFAELGFKGVAYKNLTLDETRRTLQSLDVAGVEVVFTVVSSHGYAIERRADTAIRCSDGQLTSDGEIIDYFSHKNKPALIDVPKVFIFQVCRGKVEDYVQTGPAAPLPRRVSTDAGAEPRGAAGAHYFPPESPGKRPLYSDTLVVHSTVPGHVSHRDKLDGSWYIQVLCEVFAQSAHDCHVEKLFKMVDERMQQRYHIQTSSVDSRGFNKKLYLHPGLYE